MKLPRSLICDAKLAPPTGHRRGIKQLEVAICDLKLGWHIYLSIIFPEKENLMSKGLMIPDERIEKTILLIRGQKVIIDADLAELYGVTTKALNQAVTRNDKRFPPDFMFRLTKAEKQELVTNCDRLDRLKHSSALPRVFAEQGVAMLSSVLRSERAIQVNI